jgi:hypothetical protein
MEKKQIRLSTVIQKRYIKKDSNIKQEYKKELRKAFMAGWNKGVEHGLKTSNPKKEILHEYQTHGDEVI